MIAKKFKLTITEPVPAGLYKARLEDINSFTGSDGSEALKFEWELLEGPYAGRIITGLVNPLLSPKSKLLKWTLAHLQMNTLPKDYELDPNDLIGHEVILAVGLEPRRDGAGNWNKVEGVHPAAVTEAA